MKLRAGCIVHNVGFKACLSCTSGPPRAHDVQVPGEGEVSTHRDNKAEGTSTATRGNRRTRGKAKPCTCGHASPLRAPSVRASSAIAAAHASDCQQCGASCAGPATFSASRLHRLHRLGAQAAQGFLPWCFAGRFGCLGPVALARHLPTTNMRLSMVTCQIAAEAASLPLLEPFGQSPWRSQKIQEVV